MQQNTYDQTLDQLFKQVLSNKVFLAQMMKECIKEYNDVDLKKIIDTHIEPHIMISTKEVHPRIAGSGTEINDDNKKTTYDINFYASLPESEEKIDVIVNIEAQNTYQPGYHMMNRAHYYNARNISSQYGVFFSESNYDGLRKVISIWLILDPPKKMRDSINGYRMYENHQYGNAHEKEEYINKNEIIMIYLSKESQSDFIQTLNHLRDRIFDVEKYKFLLENKYGYQFDKKTESEVIDMCNFSQYVRNEGKLEGKLEGIKEATLLSIKNIMKNFHVDALTAMKSLEIDVKDYSEYLDMLEVQ